MYAIQEKYCYRYFAGWYIDSTHERIPIWNKLNEGCVYCWYRQSMANEYMTYWYKYFPKEYYEVVKI